MIRQAINEIMKQARRPIFLIVLSSIFILPTLTLALEAKKSNSIGLYGLLQSKNLGNWLPPVRDHPRDLDQFFDSVHLEVQDGLKEKDKIDVLPGQPTTDLPFDQYAGYVTVNPDAGKALFYYFVESPNNSSVKPLLLWLNGGPGCSSIGAGAMQELGPFRVNNDKKTLYRNIFAWNNVANVIFLESPAGVGFSYSNRTSDYYSYNDSSTAKDTYTFLLNWLERFPEYKTRDFFIAGESYAGHYVPQLAYTILVNNNVNANRTKINLKGIIIGNGVLNDDTDALGFVDYLWTHALMSDEIYKGILTSCGFGNSTFSELECHHFLARSRAEVGDIDYYNIYAPLCENIPQNSSLVGSVNVYDPCSDNYVHSYLNNIKVQRALHAKPTTWHECGGHYNRTDMIDGSSGHYNSTDNPHSVLPEIKHIMQSGVRVWIYSGDVDSVVPVTSSRYSINSLQLPIKTTWRPWYSAKEVGGYIVEYEGLSFLTVRGAGHFVPTFQPERALTMISSFLNGVIPPI